ncbi:hypothetical protein [Hymenobacter wooponensis]|uniref:Uncharacterized protein n=1 Tax=Hymenobacter wooponensis TaxID=1525360 RepID=A0A4Z0MKV5_9BACT|nr:hypothetical protein [Hymenobacter wooponensis]TGD80244.1 hypothetical protein EU557_10375 [Hymenobacter wooponensis]
MNPAADLAFFQNLYNGVSLYVVPEHTTAAASVEVPPPTEAAASALPVAQVLSEALPTPAAPEQPTPVAAAPVPAAVPQPAIAPSVASAPAAPPTPVAAKLPSLANLKAQSPPPAPPVASPAPVREPVVPTLAQLPAAAAAPAGRVQPTPTQSPVAHIPFSTLGSNPNGLIILVRLPETEFRKLPRNVFLNNILKAIRLIVEDVVLVNVEHPSYPVALCTLRQALGARQFIAFGKNLLDVAVYTTQPYEPVLLFGDTAFLGASEISMLEYDAGRKKQLWQAMQRMFL